MKKLFISLLLVITVCNISGADDLNRNLCKKITMPPKEILKQRFKKSGLADFDKQNHLSDIFGEQELHPHEIIILAAHHHKPFFSHTNGSAVYMIPPSFPYIVGVLLEDNPETMECVRIGKY